jgi:hypothetical protein
VETKDNGGLPLAWVRNTMVGCCRHENRISSVRGLWVDGDAVSELGWWILLQSKLIRVLGGSPVMGMEWARAAWGR